MVLLHCPTILRCSFCSFSIIVRSIFLHKLSDLKTSPFTMADLKPTLRIPYKTVDGVDIPTDVYIPSPPPTSPCPVLIMIHGGAFMLGHAGMNNEDQIADCLQRGWIVLAIEHRLCPGVNILEGPITDVRDALAWVQNGGLKEGSKRGELQGVAEADSERVMVMGTSSGGHLALCTVCIAIVSGVTCEL